MAICDPLNRLDMLIPYPLGQLRTGSFQKAAVTRTLNDASHPVPQRVLLQLHLSFEFLVFALCTSEVPERAASSLLYS